MAAGARAKRVAPKKVGPKLALTSMALAFQNSGLKPSWRKYIDYVQEASDDGDKDMIAIMDIFNKLSVYERLQSMPEQLCDWAGVQKGALYGAVARKLYEHSTAEASMILALNHPRIVERAVKEARTKKGLKDRENLLKAGGVIPIPKTSITSVHFNNNSRNLTMTGADPAAILPSMEDDMGNFEDVEELPLLPVAPIPPVLPD